jgi:pilus assembly protein Flp/PilA
MELFKRLWNDEEGQGMVEYGLIIALIAIVVMGALTAMAGGLNNIFGQIATALGLAE